MKTLLIWIAAFIFSINIATAQMIPGRGFSLGIPPLFAQAAIGQEPTKKEAPKDAPAEEVPSTMDKVLDTGEKIVKKTVELGQEYFKGNTFSLGVAFFSANIKLTAAKENATAFATADVDTTGSDKGLDVLKLAFSLEFAPTFFSDDLKIFGYRFVLTTQEFEIHQESTPGVKWLDLEAEYIFFFGEVFFLFGEPDFHVIGGIGAGLGLLGLEGTIIGIPFEHKLTEELLPINSAFLEMRFGRIKFVVIQASRTEFDVTSPPPTTGTHSVSRVRIEDINFSLSYLFSF